MSGLLDIVRKEVNRAVLRAGAVVRRGVLGAGLSSDSEGQVSGPGGDDFAGVESWQHFGFRSRPPTSGEVLLVCPYGRGEGAIICAEHDRAHVPSCAASEVVVYGASAGGAQALLRLRPDGSVWLVPGGASVIDAGAAGTSVDFALKGTTWDVAWRVVLGTVATGLWGALVMASAYFTAAATAWTALGSEAAISPAGQGACNAAAAPATTAAAAFTSAAGLVGAYLAGSYLATKLKVT
jgi:hypothetical protein